MLIEISFNNKSISIFNIYFNTFINDFLILVVRAKFIFSLERFKKYGEKKIGYITDAFIVYRRRPIRDIPDYKIVVDYQKEICILVKNTMGFRILNKLFESHSINDKIPIDVYVYKNKFLIDLSSVDVAKIDGFNEIKDLCNL